MLTTLQTAPRPAAGGTGLLSYRPWRGRLGGPYRGVWAIARTGLWVLLRRWTFWGLYAGCLLIFLFFFFGQYLLVWIGTQLQEENVRFLFGSRIEPARLVQLLGETLKLNGSGATFRAFINVESSMVEIVLLNLRHGVFDSAHWLNTFEPVAPVSPCVFAARVERHRREVDAVNFDHRRSGHTETFARCWLTP